MNAQNAREYMPLVQALADGKTIQCNDRGEWVDVDSLYTDLYGPDEYRIKPEPRTFNLMIHKYTGIIEDNDFVSYDENIWEPITVVEVVK
jgi:hypothetical protein